MFTFVVVTTTIIAATIVIHYFKLISFAIAFITKAIAAAIIIIAISRSVAINSEFATV